MADTAVERPPARLSWPLNPPWATALGIGYVACVWWQINRRQLEEIGTALPGAMGAGAEATGVMAAMMAAGRMLGAGLEAGYYTLLWKSMGRRLPFWRMTVIVIMASIVDALAIDLVQGAQQGGASWWIQMLAGPIAATGATYGFAGMLGTFGLLTLARIAITAHAQSVALGRGIGAPLLLTAGTWLAMRLAGAWLSDLARGRSLLP